MIMQMRAIAKMSARPDDFAVTTVPVPEAGDHELLIRIWAVGVGIHDGYFLPATVQYPFPIGIEAAGTVERIGSKVTRYQIGDAIAFVSPMQAKGGTWAEFAVVDESAQITRIPAGMGFSEAAAVPVAGNTVLKAFHALNLVPGDALFVAGASGAIGSFAIQLAVAQGCMVAGSASATNHEYMAALGATVTVDYRDPGWADQIKQWRPGGVDTALAIQPGTGIECLPITRDNGRLVVVSGDQVAPQRGIRIEHIPHHIDVMPALDQLMTRIVSRQIKLEIEQVYAFENGLDALKKTQSRRARGKSVIAMPG